MPAEYCLSTDTAIECYARDGCPIGALCAAISGYYLAVWLDGSIAGGYGYGGKHYVFSGFLNKKILPQTP